MFTIKDWSKLAKVCGILAILIFFPMAWGEIAAFKGDIKSSLALLRLLLTSAGISVLLVLVYGKWLWRILWKICPKFNDWVFPDLNGRWLGGVKSNWPIVKRLHPEHAHTIETELSDHPMTIDIKQDLFGIHITLNADDKYTSSETIVVVPEKNKVSGEITLYELYSSKTKTPKSTDTPRHYGAGVLNYVRDGEVEIIKGNYWTEREWRKGLNTAGSIEVKREK